MPGQSVNKRKWWHGTFSIIDRESNVILKQFTSIDSSNPYSNALPSVIFAYSNFNTDCATSIDIPVPSFDELLSPGYFLFRPSLEDLGNSVVDINTYQEAINLNKRRIFEFKRNAAYNFNDTDCSSTEPNYVDSFVYNTITNSLNSNVFRYPVLPLYSQIGCCEVELSTPTENLPVLGEIDRATRVWYITYNSSTLIYSLYSYDFSLLSNALVFKGDIDISRAGENIVIFDITWIPSDNSLIAICQDGFRRLSPGDSSNSAILGDLIPLNFDVQGYSLFPISSLDATLYKCVIEYNIYDNFVYVFAPLSNESNSFSSPYLYRFSYNSSGMRLEYWNYINLMISSTDYFLGGLAFSSNENGPEGIAYCIFDHNLSTIGIQDGANFGAITQVGSGDLLASMNTLSFVKNSDLQIDENVLYTTTYPGQLFLVNPSNGVATSISSSINALAIGSSSTINGEDTRVSPFPFLLGKSHWLFMVDISSTMSTGNRLNKVKNALISMLRTYVRYGDKITIMWFNDSSNKFSKELRTYVDVNEAINTINTYFIPYGGTQFCGAFSNISQNFSDLKNIFIISDGTFDDCGTSSSVWEANLASTIASIRQVNAGVNFTTVGVSINSGKEKLQFIAQQSGGIYVDW